MDPPILLFPDLLISKKAEKAGKLRPKINKGTPALRAVSIDDRAANAAGPDTGGSGSGVQRDCG
jgi:hypothetical protein